jgi:hypothetical protein
VVSFCVATGIATAALIASLHVSEQALAVRLMLEVAKPLPLCRSDPLSMR